MGITYPTIKPRFDQNSSSRPHFRTPVKQLSKSQSPLVITSPFWTPLASHWWLPSIHRIFQKKNWSDWWICSQVDGKTQIVISPIECLNQCFLLFFQVMTPVKRLQRRALLALYWLKVHQFLLCSMFCSWDLNIKKVLLTVFCSHLNPLLYRTFPTGPLRPCAQRKMTCSHLVAVLAGHPVRRFSALHGYLQAQNLDEHDRHQHPVQSLLLCSK